MSETLLQVRNLGKHFGGFIALDDISLDIKEGERVGLIGPNGSGKSTLVNCLSGALKHDSGWIRFDDQALDGLPAYQRTRLGLARSFQLPKPFRSLTVVQNLHVPLLFTAKHRAGAHLSTAQIDARCEELLHMVALEGKALALPGDLTQIEMRKLELARAMAAAPKLLIADEAMAGLSHSEIDDILALLVKLNDAGVTVILIEHIMRAVMSFSQRIICLVAGKKIADGKPHEVMLNPDVERAYLGE